MSKATAGKRRTASGPPLPVPRQRDDNRFNQLLDMASTGNLEAEADLWREYGFDFERDEP